jgi:hypothetical protein
MFEIEWAFRLKQDKVYKCINMFIVYFLSL